MAAFSHPDFVLDPFLQLQKTNTFSSLQEKETITKPSSSQDYRQEIPNLHEISHFADNPEVPSTDTLASPVIVNQHSTSPSFMVDPESGWVHVAPLITPILMEQKRKHVDTWKGSEIESKGEKQCCNDSKKSSSHRKKRNSTSTRKEKKVRQQPLTGFVHVRARRGEATDPHSLAERVRRKKISTRMKLLQSLVPGCDKITGKALILEEIIRYVQTLQNQVEFLAAKLEFVSGIGNDFQANCHMNTLAPKGIYSSLVQESNSNHQLSSFVEATPQFSMFLDQEATNATTYQLLNYNIN